MGVLHQQLGFANAKGQKGVMANEFICRTGSMLFARLLMGAASCSVVPSRLDLPANFLLPAWNRKAKLP
jgi:hypothetical protein